MISLKRFRVAITLTCITCLILCTAGFKACPKSEKDRDVAFARDLVSSMEAATPIIAQKNAQLAARWTTATGSARRVVDAFANSDSTTAVSLIRDILPVFTQVVRELGSSQDLLIALALGQIALNFWINHYLNSSSGDTAIALTREAAREGNAVDVVQDFKSLPQFGCQLRPDRCR